MSRQVKFITAPVEEKGDFGAYYPNAVIAFFEVFKNSQEYLGAEYGDAQYTKSDNFVESLHYKGAWWPNPESKQRGYKPKPLINQDAKPDDDELIFDIDVDKTQYAKIIQSPGDAWENALRLVETHYRTEVVK